ncbi:PAS domain S-box protein [Chloroflexota bacterium]
MKDESKTKEQLIKELAEIRQRLAELETSETDHKQAWEEMKSLVEQQNILFEYAPDAYYLNDLKGTFVDGNKAAEEMTGYKKRELIGKNFFKLSLLPPSQIQKAARLLAINVLGKPTGPDELTLRKKDGGQVIAEIRTFPVDIKGDKLVIGIARDITERKRVEDALQEAHQELEIKVKERTAELTRANEELRAEITERQQVEEKLRKSEEQYRLVSDNTSDIISIATFNLNPVFKYVSPSIQAYGYKPEDLIGTRCFDIIHLEDRKPLSSLLKQYLTAKVKGLLIGRESPIVESIEYRARDKSGNWYYFQGTTNLVENQIIIISRDITERKQSEEQLRFLSTITEQISDSVLVTDTDYKILYGNKAAEDLFGYCLDGLIGMKPDMLNAEPQAESIQEDVYQTVSLGKVWSGQILNRRKDGSTFLCEFKVSPVRDQEGKVKYYVGVQRDITERKQAEEREKQLQQELIISNRLATVGTMASGIAHEINNPLTGVIGFSDLLLKKDLPEDIEKDVNIIYEGARRIASVTNQMLAFARQHPTERANDNINDIIETTLAMRAYEIESSNIKVTTDLASDIPLTLCDAGQLQQVFLNIILNAGTEMMLAHSKGNLTVTTERIDNNIRVSFKDDGPGISKNDLERIFDPFFTTRDPDKGTGLGLSICHSIVTQHGGKIYAQSRWGKGATFFVELPIITETEQFKFTELSARKPEEVSGARILVVDDDTIVQELLTTILAEEGYQVEIVGNGNDALNRLDSEHYDVIMLDIKLPGMSGIELYNHLQEKAKSLVRKVLFITGDTVSEDTMVFVKNTRTPYITKPFDAAQLKKEMGRLLGEST